MRVTKAIREYVEEEIYKKYDEYSANIGKEYYAEKDNVLKDIQKIIDSTNAVIIDVLKRKGFDYEYRYRNNNLITIDGYIRKTDVEQSINNQRVQLRDKAKKKIKEVLFNLEMGETQKAELKQVIDSITVE